MRDDLILNGEQSADGKYLVLSPDVKLVLDPAFYKAKRFGNLSLMPEDMEFSEDSTGIEHVVTEDLGVERFGNLTLASEEGPIGPVDLNFDCGVTRGENRYILRHGTYKKDDLFALYLANTDTSPVLLGLGDVNFEEESIAKLLGFGIKDEFQRRGYGTVFLAAIERECAKTNMLLLLHHPLRQQIQFYVGVGYRYLIHSDGPDFAKVLNPGFDTQLLVPDS